MEEREFKKAVEKWEREYEKDDKEYFRAINNKDNIKEILIFLKKWKCRTPNIEILKIDKELQKKLIENKNDLIKLKDQNIENIDLEKYEKEIKNIFEKIISINHIGATSTSKILHIKFPKLFIMWDIPIAQHYGYYQNEIGYFKFLKEMKNIAKSELVKEKTKKKTIPKIIDEYNYIITRKNKNE